MENLTEAPPATLEQIAALERQYLLQTYSRYPIVLSRGKGVFVFDNYGNGFIDFFFGLRV
jgi:acetylornithine/N-succinyldiaminopimelate aminotransferase